jgi:putative acetyltransferase
MIILPGNFENPKLLALLRLHLAGMYANSPPESVNAFGLSSLEASDVRVYTAWRADKLLGMAALRELDADTGEIKSMRTDPAHLREGVAKALLDHVLSVANERGYRPEPRNRLRKGVRACARTLPQERLRQW